MHLMYQRRPFRANFCDPLNRIVLCCHGIRGLVLPSQTSDRNMSLTRIHACGSNRLKISCTFRDGFNRIFDAHPPVSAYPSYSQTRRRSFFARKDLGATLDKTSRPISLIARKIMTLNVSMVSAIVYISADPSLQRLTYCQPKMVTNRASLCASPLPCPGILVKTSLNLYQNL